MRSVCMICCKMKTVHAFFLGKKSIFALGTFLRQHFFLYLAKHSNAHILFSPKVHLAPFCARQAIYKTRFAKEEYLNLANHYPYRSTLAMFRLSSHFHIDCYVHSWIINLINIMSLLCHCCHGSCIS